MSDQSDSKALEPPHPSIHRDYIERSDDLAGKLALALHVVDALLEDEGTQGRLLDSFKTDMRGCATITKNGNKYDVRRRPQAPMGS